MANPIRISPQKDFRGKDNCPQCLSHVNYNQAIHEFNNKVISRVQTLPQPHVLPKGPLNYAILRLHQEAVWMKLALYENTPQRRTSKGQVRTQFSGNRHPHRYWSCTFFNQGRYYNLLEKNSP